MEEQVGLLGMDSLSSTPYESAVCSPRSSTDRAASSYYSGSAPTYPLAIRRDIRSLPASDIGFFAPSSNASFCEETSSEDFDFSARFSETDPSWSPAPMSSADELFCNGQIRPLWYNSEDLARLSSDYGSTHIDDDEDTHFDFQSSADYKFSMFSAADSPACTRNNLQRYVGHGNNGPWASLDDEYSRYSHGKVTKAGMEDAGEEQRAKRIVQKWRAYSRDAHDEMIAKQVMMVKVEETRGRRACHNKEGGIRRTRSLSPLRVFHMDDEMPKQSFESCRDEKQEEQVTPMAIGKGRRLTLRELLHSRSQAEHMSNQKRAENQPNNYHMETGMKKKREEGRGFCFRSPAKQPVDNKVKGSNYTWQQLPGHHQAFMAAHGVQYASHRVHTEHIRQQTFLPYRHGLLGCLGFTSKSYRSVAGMQTFHSKSQGTRRSTGYDSSHS